MVKKEQEPVEVYFFQLTVTPEVYSSIAILERKRLNVASQPHVRGQPQKLRFQVCFERPNFSLNA
mgnify:CR=1 FL=1